MPMARVGPMPSRASRDAAACAEGLKRRRWRAPADGTVRRRRRCMADGGTAAGLLARRWPESAALVPNWVYTDPDIFVREQERIFSGPSWLYTCLEAEIPNPGDFTRSRLGAREVVAVRNRDGAVAVLVNRCAHRSMQFCMQNR